MRFRGKQVYEGKEGMLPHECLNGSIVFLLNHKFAKNNTPIFHMETLFHFFTNKTVAAKPR